MDPATAFGIVAGVIQLVTFGASVVKTSSEIYQSASSLSSNNEKLSQLAVEATSLTESLQRRVKDANSQIPALSPEDDAILRASKLCEERAEELKNALEKLRSKSGKRKGIGSFFSALKTQIKKSNIEDLAQKLSDTRQLLDSTLLARILSSLTDTSSGKPSPVTANDIDSWRVFNLDVTRKMLDQLAYQLTAQQHNDAIETRELITAKHEEHLDSASFERWCGDLLDSLKFNGMHYREETLTAAYPMTFAWALRNGPSKVSDGQLVWSNLAKWAHDTQPLFWIKGHPGAGKSTLMKYLADDQKKSLQYAFRLHSGASPLMLRYFFWRSGRDEQKSLNGCIRSLIHQIITRDRRTATFLNIFNSRLRPTWDREGLITIFDQLLGQSRIMERIPCLFIDGLDECQVEDQLPAVEWVLDLSRRKAIKICVSSRDENLFNDLLSEVPSLRIQDFTRKDMELMVVQSLRKNDPRLHSTNEFTKFVQKATSLICDGSNGVFLWTSLVLSELVEDLRDGTNLDTLLNGLESKNTTLNGLFTQMSEKALRYPYESSKFFTFFMTAEHATIFDFFLLTQLPAESFEDLLAKVMRHGGNDMESIQKRMNATRKLIKSRCFGMLSITDGSVQESDLEADWHTSHPKKLAHFIESRWATCRVAWLHRTAADFVMADSKIQTMFQQSSYKPRDALHDTFMQVVFYCGLRFRQGSKDPAHLTIELCQRIADLSNARYEGEAARPSYMEAAETGDQILRHMLPSILSKAILDDSNNIARLPLGPWTKQIMWNFTERNMDDLADGIILVSMFARHGLHFERDQVVDFVAKTRPSLSTNRRLASLALLALQQSNTGQLNVKLNFEILQAGADPNMHISTDPETHLACHLRVTAGERFPVAYSSSPEEFSSPEYESDSCMVYFRGIPYPPSDGDQLKPSGLTIWEHHLCNILHAGAFKRAERTGNRPYHPRSFDEMLTQTMLLLQHGADAAGVAKFSLLVGAHHLLVQASAAYCLNILCKAYKRTVHVSVDHKTSDSLNAKKELTVLAHRSYCADCLLTSSWTSLSQSQAEPLEVALKNTLEFMTPEAIGRASFDGLDHLEGLKGQDLAHICPRSLTPRFPGRGSRGPYMDPNLLEDDPEANFPVYEPPGGISDEFFTRACNGVRKLMLERRWSMPGTITTDLPAEAEFLAANKSPETRHALRYPLFGRQTYHGFDSRKKERRSFIEHHPDALFWRQPPNQVAQIDIRQKVWNGERLS